MRAGPSLLSCLLSPLACGCMIVEKGLFDTASTPESAELSPSTPADEPADGGAEPERPAPTSPTLRLSWADDTLEITSSPPSPGMWVGLAETRGPCLELGACWTGEDCREGAPDAEGGPWGPLCRGLDAAGALRLQGGAPISAVDLEHTALRPDTAAHITWTLWSAGEAGPSAPCWSGGADPEAAPGCTATAER